MPPHMTFFGTVRRHDPQRTAVGFGENIRGMSQGVARADGTAHVNICGLGMHHVGDEEGLQRVGGVVTSYMQSAPRDGGG